MGVSAYSAAQSVMLVGDEEGGIPIKRIGLSALA
jgi:hypothetical protein